MSLQPIVTLTLNPAVDKSCRVERVAPDRKLRCSRPEYHPGGGGINVARAISRLGGSAEALWACGGPAGQRLQQLLDEEGVSHVPIKIRGETRQSLVVGETSSDQQYRFNMPGAELDAADLQAFSQAMEQADPPPAWCVLSGSLPPGADEAAYARLSERLPATTKVALDTSGAPLRQGLAASVTLVKPNLTELAQLAGHPIEDDREVRAVAGKLVEDGMAEIVLTSLGSGGAVLSTSAGHVHLRAPTVHIRSKVGAGDSTVGGMVLALSRGAPALEAARRGVAAGAAAVMTAGTELCRQQDAERLYREMSEDG